MGEAHFEPVESSAPAGNRLHISLQEHQTVPNAAICLSALSTIITVLGCVPVSLICFFFFENLKTLLKHKTFCLNAKLCSWSLVLTRQPTTPNSTRQYQRKMTKRLTRPTKPISARTNQSHQLPEATTSSACLSDTLLILDWMWSTPNRQQNQPAEDTPPQQSPLSIIGFVSCRSAPDPNIPPPQQSSMRG